MSERPNLKRFREQLTSREVPTDEEGEAAPAAEPAARDDTADQRALDALARGEEPPVNGRTFEPVMMGIPPEPAPPPAPIAMAGAVTNLFMHGYRQLDADQSNALRGAKDLALMLHNHLHACEGSPIGEPDFASREIQQAGLRLEEAMLWLEKFYAI